MSLLVFATETNYQTMQLVSVLDLAIENRESKKCAMAGNLKYAQPWRTHVVKIRILNPNGAPAKFLTNSGGLPLRKTLNCCLTNQQRVRNDGGSSEKPQRYHSCGRIG